MSPAVTKVTCALASPDNFTLTVIRYRISLLLLCGSLHARQDLIECRTIKKPAVRHNHADFPGVPNILERICAQQHQIGDIARFD
jgi:hypothetical protein